MLNVKTFSILAIAGSAAALPQWGNFLGTGKYFSGDLGDTDAAAATAIEIVTHYATVTVAAGYDGGYSGKGGYGGGYNGHKEPETTEAAATPSSTPASSSPAPVATPSFSFAPAAPAAPAASSFSFAPAAPAAPASSTSAPAAPAASSSAPVASSGSSDSGYMGIVNEWRGKLGLSSLVQSDTLQANALKTAVDGNGQMVHELNPGSFAQVLAPGSADDFEKVFVGGWLCEISTLPGLNGICATMSQGWAYDGQTGHAEILTSKAYSKIGCALAKGIWGCDLA